MQGSPTSLNLTTAHSDLHSTLEFLHGSPGCTFGHRFLPIGLCNLCENYVLRWTPVSNQVANIVLDPRSLAAIEYFILMVDSLVRLVPQFSMVVVAPDWLVAVTLASLGFDPVLFPLPPPIRWWVWMVPWPPWQRPWLWMCSLGIGVTPSCNGSSSWVFYVVTNCEGIPFAPSGPGLIWPMYGSMAGGFSPPLSSINFAR